MNPLRVQECRHTHTMSFNEWVEKLNVSSLYVEPEKFFDKNPKNCYLPFSLYDKPKKQNLVSKILKFFSIN